MKYANDPPRPAQCTGPAVSAKITASGVFKTVAG